MHECKYKKRRTRKSVNFEILRRVGIPHVLHSAVYLKKDLQM